MNPSPALLEGLACPRNLPAAAQPAECHRAIVRPLRLAEIAPPANYGRMRIPGTLSVGRCTLRTRAEIAAAPVLHLLHDLGRGVRQPVRLWASGNSPSGWTGVASCLYLDNAVGVAPQIFRCVPSDPSDTPFCGRLNGPVACGCPQCLPSDCQVQRQCASGWIEEMPRRMCRFHPAAWHCSSKNTSP
jgi:hypothetical protein